LRRANVIALGVAAGAMLLLAAAPAFAAGAADAANGTEPARAEVVIKIIVGLAALVVLAFLGGHRKVRQLERAIGISHAMTAGFPFVALGLIGALPAVGVLTDDVLVKLTPLMHFGLGWLGFMVGFRFVFPALDKVPRGTAMLVAVEAALPFACITVACGALLLLFGSAIDDGEFVRDAVVAGVIALLLLAAFFRPHGEDIAWRLPAVGWVFVELGAGVALGLLMYTMLRHRDTVAEFLAVTIGFIAFAAGIADFLHLSPIVLCFVAGCLVANFPSDHREKLWRTFCRLERPIHYIFLTVVGALWVVDDWRGWVLVPAFVASRLVGKWLGLVAGRKALREQGSIPEENRVIVAPLSVLSIAIVVSVQSLYHGEALPWIVTAVLGGAMVTEVLVQLVAPDRPNARAAGERLAVAAKGTEAADPVSGE